MNSWAICYRDAIPLVLPCPSGKQCGDRYQLIETRGPDVSRTPVVRSKSFAQLLTMRAGNMLRGRS